MAQTLYDKDTIEFLDRMQQESDVRRDLTPIKDAELNMRFVRGAQGGMDDVPGLAGRDTLQYRFSMNLLGVLLKRKVALITDARPKMMVESRAGKHRQGTADTFKVIDEAMWDEQNLELEFAYELFRAGTVGATLCVPVWDRAADYGRGDVRFRFYDPRWYSVDPSVTRARKLQEHGEFLQVREIVSLGWARERYRQRAEEIEPHQQWSKYGTGAPGGVSGFVRGIVSAIGGQPWSLDRATEDSAVPRIEMRHSWFRDYERDARGQPMFAKARLIRHIVDDGKIVLADEPMAAVHGQIPGHIFDWDIELEHPWGSPEPQNLRRIQYTLNRILGQIVENVLLTNRIKVIGDTDAVDAATWKALSANNNGLILRKKLGRTLSVELPLQFPSHLLALVSFLVGAVDMVSGINDATRGIRPPGVVSGSAISELAQQAQTVVRLEARCFENWLARIFQQVNALVWQYMQTNRLLHVMGPRLELVQFEFDRQKFVHDANGLELPRDAWQDFAFRVMPGSSLASTRIQRGVMAMNLYQAGLIPGDEVLRAAEWEDPKGTYERAMEARAKGGGMPVGRNGKPSRPIRLPGTRAGGL